MTDCEHCQHPEHGIYDMNRACCVGRHIAGTPGEARQAAMKAFYTKRKGSDFAAQVEAVILKASAQ